MDELGVEKLDVIDWLELPDHLLFEIVGKLNSFFDYARFGAVCHKWQSLIFNGEEVCCSNLPPQLPLLLVPTPPPPPPQPHTEQEEEKKKKKKKKRRRNTATRTTRSCSFYRITDKKVVYPQIQLKMPLTRHFRGSGHGWLVTIDDDKSSNFRVQLINPFFFPAPKVIPLPPLTAFPFVLDSHGMIEDTVGNSLFVRKAVLTADPISNPKDYMVILIWGEYRRLAFYKPGEEAWTPIGYHSFKGLFEDVINYKGKVYAVHHHGTLAICNMENRMAMKILEPPVGTLAPHKKYLVESAGDLLQVHRETRSLNRPTYSTLGFKVFKLSLDPLGERKPYSKEVKDLRGHALFLGNSLSISVCASDFPGCKPNCIYYTDDNTESIDTGRSGPHDIGMFNLEDGSFEKHYPTNIHDSIWPNPIWIEPRLPLKKQAKENKVPLVFTFRSS